MAPPGGPDSGMHRNSNQTNSHHDGAMNPPSRAMLAVFSASLKLRGRFVAMEEHPAGIRAIDREIAWRKLAAFTG